MGDLKALVPWRDQTLIQYQVASLADGGVSPIIVVLGHQAEKIEPLVKSTRAVLCVHNPDYLQGKTTSIKTGLRLLQGLTESTNDTVRANAILVLSVDQPRSPEIIRRLIELHFRGTADSPPKLPALITIPTYRGKGGHPIVFSSSLMPELMEISEDTLGLRAIVHRHNEDTQRIEMASSEVLIDLNTPKDYQSALGNLSSQV